MTRNLISKRADILHEVVESADKRAKNDQREGKTTIGDMVITAPAVIGEEMVKRFVPHKVKDVFSKAEETISKMPAKLRIAEKAQIDASKGAVKSLLQYASENAGTEKGMNAEEALERGPPGALDGAKSSLKDQAGKKLIKEGKETYQNLKNKSGHGKKASQEDSVVHAPAVPHFQRQGQDIPRQTSQRLDPELRYDLTGQIGDNEMKKYSRRLPMAEKDGNRTVRKLASEVDSQWPELKGAERDRKIVSLMLERKINNVITRDIGKRHRPVAKNAE